MKNPTASAAFKIFAVPAALALLAAPLEAASKKKKVEEIPLVRATGEVPENQLLDVGIQVLGHGLPSDDDELFELEEKGVYEDVRKSEARYIPVRLMDTLQTTGFWGAVRVVPSGMDSVDVAVSGTIVESSGKRIILDLRAVDAKGRVWIEKTYKHRADHRAYRESRDGFVRLPFQFLYNKIANDLLAARNKLDDEQLVEIRRVSELKFAADVAPMPFEEYLGHDRRGRTVVDHLPAEGDPMMQRIERIRERDYVFIDTLTEHYTNFYALMDESYASWRKYSYEEILARQKAKRQARMRQALGALAILGGIAAKAEGGRSSSGLGDVAIIGGAMALQSGMTKDKEAKMHVESLRELASSFDAEMEPLLVDVEGQTLRLSGSAEAQYDEWRRLLREIFLHETGLPVDPDTGEEIAGEAPGDADSTSTPPQSQEN